MSYPFLLTIHGSTRVKLATNFNATPMLRYSFYSRALGNLQQALFCFENRLVFAHELTETSAKGSAYGELGNLHRSMGNFEQAAACYGQQLKLAKQCQDLESESDAECGLGEVRR